MIHLTRVFVRRALIVLGVSVVSGCVTSNDHYSWGQYQQLLLAMYTQPGSADASTQISVLQEDIQKAAAEGKPIPPGLYAHLGYMYAIEGNVEASQQAFEEEKVRFPESAKFINGMIERAKSGEDDKK